VSVFIEGAKSTGLVQQTIDRYGLKGIQVARLIHADERALSGDEVRCGSNSVIQLGQPHVRSSIESGP
jgi:hypothetical protein